MPYFEKEEGEARTEPSAPVDFKNTAEILSQGEMRATQTQTFVPGRRLTGIMCLANMVLLSR